MSNLVLVGHGSLYYMSMEQLYCAIRSYEKDSGTKRPEQTWHQESVGNVVKVEGKIAHWFQKGDGFVQTSLPVAVTPLGQLFEVEVVRAVNAGKRPDSELGFAIGLSAKAPRPKKDETRRRSRIAGLPVEMVPSTSRVPNIGWARGRLQKPLRKKGTCK